MDKVNFLIRYIHHQLFAGNLHAVHSPFLFHLYSEMLSEKQYYAFDKIEKLRNELLFNDSEIEITDFGAGSGQLNHKRRKVKDIVKTSQKPPNQAQSLFQIALNSQPRTIVELGTSLGITTLYLSQVDNRSIVHTFEGCPNTLNKAKENFSKFGCKNIESHLGDFSSTLPNFLESKPTLDFVFFDGNHRYQPTIQYFNWLLPYSHYDTVFIFDDIHWSKEMERAWKEIQEHPKVIVSVDFFHFGVIFFKKEMSKQRFTLKI